ncbi:MAG: glycosyltransferase family 4 protein [Candidatus Altiarchaeota archaeon]|nr:glycosyltransferase family 4 protein [Candidatus Altiarchaeota archaeon]
MNKRDENPTIAFIIDEFSDKSNELERATWTDKNRFKRIFCAVRGYIDNPECLRDCQDAEIIDLDGKSFLDPAAIIKLYHVMKREDIDVIHTFFHRSGLLVRMLSIFTKKKIVHSFCSHYSKYSLVSRIAHLITSPLIDEAIFVSESSVKSLNWVEKKAYLGKSHVVHNGVDIEKIEKTKKQKADVLKKYHIPTDKTLLFTSSRIEPVKDIETIVEAFKKIKKSAPNTYLIIAGGGKDKKNPKNIPEETLSHSGVLFLGKIRKKDVYAILYSIDYFIMASRWEGISLSVLEAMAASKPTILSDIPSFREIALDGDTAVFFKTGDSEDLAKKAINLIEDLRLSKKLGQQAHKHVVDNFNKDKVSKAYEKIYYNMIYKK